MCNNTSLYNSYKKIKITKFFFINDKKWKHLSWNYLEIEPYTFWSWKQWDIIYTCSNCQSSMIYGLVVHRFMTETGRALDFNRDNGCKFHICYVQMSELSLQYYPIIYLISLVVNVGMYWWLAVSISNANTYW